MRPSRFVSLAFLAAAGAASACAQREEPLAMVTLEQRGETLFTEETFDGNGRTCSTCHEPDVFGTITPEFVQEQFAQDPTGPLFRSIDSDDGQGDSYERLLEHATVRVPIEAPFDEVVGRSIRRCDAPEETTIVVHRGNPSVFNVALEAALMHDGREGGDLETQALNAVHTHNEPGREPTPEELTAIARFQEGLFSHAALKAFLDRGAELGLPAGVTESEIRGRQFLEPNRQCGVCHSGPMLNRTSEFHPDAPGARVETTAVGAEPDNPNEKFEWCYVDPATGEVSPPPGLPDLPPWVMQGRVFRLPVSDPGIALVRLPERDFLQPMPDGSEMLVTTAMLSGAVGLPLFKIPTLWGSPNTAPYFHDNSAKSLDEVLVQYNFMFTQFTGLAELVGCNPQPADCLSEQDRTDIVNFFQLLAFDAGGIRPQ